MPTFRNRTRRLARRLAIVTTLALAAPLAVITTSTAAPPGGDATVQREARRVDKVPTPKPKWFDCQVVFGPGAECATVRLPMDYDYPKGRKTSVAVLRIKALDQENKIGSLFLNPGGPGGSGVGIAASAPYFLPPEVLDRFDIVGVDPRGTNFGSNVRCFKNVGEQIAAIGALFALPFPWTDPEEIASTTAGRRLGKACSSRGKPLSKSMSTAQVARDMDLMRRAVGDSRLNFLGFSYGSYLGNVYANMFPNRVRAVVIDGVLDPVAWAGRKRNNDLPSTVRLKSGEGAVKALQEILERCGNAGEEYCGFAAYGDPAQNYTTIMDALKEEPIVIYDPDFDETFELTYAMVVSFLLGDLYAPEGAVYVDWDLTAVWELLQSSGERRPTGKQDEARQWLLDKFRSEKAARAADASDRRDRAEAFGYGFPYENSLEVFASVLCTDGINPERASAWRQFADISDARAPDFGRLWTWPSVPCASRTWTVRDEDAHRWPFNRETRNPVLVIGNYWDPATNYAGAVAVANQLPNSYLLSSDSWGHTAYGTSECVVEATAQYLLALELPPRGTRCVGDFQPFSDLPEAPGLGARPPERPRPLPPVVPPFPGALPRR